MLLDLDEGPEGCKDKEQTGTYGSAMEAGGLAGWLFRQIKGRALRLPLLGQAYLAALFRGQGHRVRAMRQFPEEADLILMATSIVGWQHELDLARRFKAKRSTVLGFTGAFAAACPALFLEVGDFVVTGEVEAWAMNCRDLPAERGVVGERLCADLDELPLPDWTGFPLDEYGYWPLLKRRPFLTVAASRGCPHGCSYCHYGPAQGKKWRPRSPEGVVAELVRNVKVHGARSVLFRDLVFTQDRERCLELCRRMEGAGLAIEWACETRPDLLDEELLRAMARAGLRGLNLGVEAIDPAVLAGTGRKPVAWSALQQLVRSCRERSIRSNAFWILGFPEDDASTLRRRIDRAVALDTDLAQFCVLTPMPGTAFHDELKAQGRLLDVDWSRYTTYNPVMRLDGSTPEEICRFRDEAYRRFFLRPSWLLRRGAPLLLSS